VHPTPEPAVKGDAVFRIFVLVVVVLAALVVGLGLFGYARQRAFAGKALDTFRAGARPQGQAIRHEALPEGLPEPVRRWIVRAVPDGTPMPTRVTARQEGSMWLEPGKPEAPLRAAQEYTVDPAAFVWDATIRVSGVPFYGLDTLTEDSVLFSGRLAGLVTLFSGSDLEVRRSSMLRYLGEIVWLPQALARTGTVRWEPIDGRSARAFLESGGQSISGVFAFDDEGRPVSFSATRPRDVNGKTVPTPWRGEYWDYVRVDGVEIPSKAKVSWLLPEGPFTYWEAEIHDLAFHP
jgi:hypothetical protein